jgi:hypothetical protein
MKGLLKSSIIRLCLRRNFPKSSPTKSLSLLFLLQLSFFSLFLHEHEPNSYEYEIEHQ